MLEQKGLTITHSLRHQFPISDILLTSGTAHRNRRLVNMNHSFLSRHFRSQRLLNEDAVPARLRS